MIESENKILLGTETLEFTYRDVILFTLRWKDVKEIVAYKEDLFGCDSICLGFRVTDQDEYKRVFEEADGYKALLIELERRFPDIRKDWFYDVAFPAFVPNWTTIWGRPMANKAK